MFNYCSCSALAMNRDESFERKTEALQYWPELKVYCGRDLEKGGTWLAINQKGKRFNNFIYFNSPMPPYM